MDFIIIPVRVLAVMTVLVILIRVAYFCISRFKKTDSSVSAVFAAELPVQQEKVLSAEADVQLLTFCTFESTLLDSYLKRMKTVQLRGNDRLLDGRGKNHALKAMAASVDKPVPCILDQLGDTFS